MLICVRFFNHEWTRIHTNFGMDSLGIGMSEWTMMDADLCAFFSTTNGQQLSFDPEGRCILAGGFIPRSTGYKPVLHSPPPCSTDLQSVNRVTPCVFLAQCERSMNEVAAGQLHASSNPRVTSPCYTHHHPVARICNP